MYCVLLYYKGYTISVDNYMYRIVMFPFKCFIRLSDCHKEIDRIEKDLNEPNDKSGLGKKIS